MTNLGNGDPQKQIEEMLSVTQVESYMQSDVIDIVNLWIFTSLTSSEHAIRLEYETTFFWSTSIEGRIKYDFFFSSRMLPLSFINWQLGRVLAHISLFVLLAPPGMELVNSPSAIVHLNEADNSLLRTCIRQSSSRSTCASFPARTQRQVETLIGRRARTTPCLFR